MKVLHVINDLSVPRGAERLVSDIVSNCSDHYVATFQGSGTRYYNLPHDRSYHLKGPIDLIMFLHREKRNFDVIHFHLFPAFYFAVLVGSKAVVHEHGDGTNNRRHGRLLFKILEHFVYNKVNTVLCINEDAKENLIKWQPALSHKILVLANFVPSSFGRISARNNFGREIRTLGMVAAFDENKQHEILLRALVNVDKNKRLHLVGAGAGLRQMKQLTHELNLRDRVTFHGIVDDVNKIYEMCDLMLLISKNESFGLVVLEAASYGLRTICSDIPALRQTVAFSEDLVQNNTNAIETKINNFSYGTADHVILEQHLSNYQITSYLNELNAIYRKVCK